MLAAWMLYTVVVTGLAALAALALERAAGLVGRSLRWVWGGGITLAITLALAPVALPSLPLGGWAGALDQEASVGAPTVVATGSTLESPFRVTESGWFAALSTPLAIGWAVLALLLILVATGSLVRLNRAMRGWARSSALGRPVLLSRDEGPAVVGFFRGEVVLPSWCLAIPEGGLRLILAHEEEHIGSRDNLLVGGALALCVLFPWNPGIWWMAFRLREAVEVDCDRRVLRRYPSEARRYGELLLSMGARAQSDLAAFATFAAGRPTLGRRIQMLTPDKSERPYRRALLLTVGGGLLVLAACLVPGPDRELSPLAPELEAPAAEGGAENAPPPARDPGTLQSEPAFTAFTVRPELRNRARFEELLESEYPPLLRDAGMGGTVVIHFFIGEDGNVQNSVVAQSSGHPALDEAALRVSKELEFTPARNYDQIVPVWVQIPLTFRSRTP